MSKRGIIGATTFAFGLTACLSTSDGQPQTEEAAVEAAERATRGAYTNDADAVLAFMTEECRANVDEQEVELALLFAAGLFSEGDFDVDDLRVEGTATSYDGDSATIELELIPPEGADLGFFELGSSEVDVIYENGRWVSEDCDFEDTSEADAEALDAGLEELGYEATRDDPIPAQLAAPIGEGFSMVVTDYLPDAAARITELSESEPFIEEGEQIALMSYRLGYTGEEEPGNASSPTFQLVGADGVGIDADSCGFIPGQLYFSGRSMFSGGAVDSFVCFVAAPDQFRGALLSVEVGFGDRAVFFDPNTAAAAPTTIETTRGPAPDGDLTDARLAPAALGTPVDVGEGWTMTVHGAALDATATVLAASEFNDPPPDGFVYGLIEIELTYDGEEEPASVFAVDAGVVGDSNVSAEECSVSGVPDEFDRFGELFSGGSTRGNVCYVVDVTDVDSLLAFASADFFDDDRDFFALR